MLEAAGITLVVALVLMALGYLFSTIKSYYSIVDVIWAYSFLFVAVFLNLKLGFSDHLIYLTIPVVLWSFRLGTHLLTRLLKHYPEEDGRYRDLKKDWKGQLHRNFALFYLFQAFSVVFLSMPLLVVASNPDQAIKPFLYIGLGISLIGWLGESISDRQLAKFRSHPNNKGEVCKAGLWNYSRHPNYFFEWTIWVGFAVMATTVAHGYLAWVSPMTMYFLLNFVTGIPYAEAQSLKSRGQKFIDYRLSTNAFFPGPKRSPKIN